VIVRIPEQQASLAQSGEIESIRDQAHRMGQVPFLTEHDHRVPARYRRLDVILDGRVRQAAIEVRDLVVLTVVHADRVIAADPLTPAMQPQASVERALIRRQLGVADKEEVRLKATLGQRPRQLFDPNPEAARLRIFVGALEGEEDEGGLLRLEHQESLTRNSSSAYA